MSLCSQFAVTIILPLLLLKAEAEIFQPPTTKCSFKKYDQTSNLGARTVVVVEDTKRILSFNNFHRGINHNIIMTKRRKRHGKTTFNDNAVLQNYLLAFAPPRFDDFLDSIIGTWSIPTRRKDSSIINIPVPTSGNVEEVMRSCGGAVQGIREIHYPNVSFDTMYHNRADDGFVYFDCGSYSAGPTRIDDSVDGNGFNIPSLVSSISIPTVPKTRMIISTSPLFNCLLVRGKMSSDDEQEEEEGESTLQSQETVLHLDDTSSSIEWNEEILCRMSSPSQPWMLPRATWTKFASKNDMIEKEMDQSNGIGHNTMQSWVHISLSSSTEGKITENTNDISFSNRQLWYNDGISSIMKSFKISTVTQTGTILNNSSVKAFLRCYDDESQLKAVIMQSGKIVHENQK